MVSVAIAQRIGREEYHNSGPGWLGYCSRLPPEEVWSMKKTLASLAVVLLLGSLGCANWQKYTPRGTDDKAIELEIRKNLTGQGYTGMKIDVDHGVVTLTGNVKTSSDRQRAYDEAAKVHGVRRVINRISITG
jgi:BON domain-containing protein